MDGELLRNEIWLLVRNISESLNGAFTPVIADRGLTLAQLRLLAACRADPETTVGSLSRGIGIAPANVSAMCKRLESAGLLVRARDSHDERVVRVRLTGMGICTVEAIDAALRERYAAFFQRENPEEMRQILEGLRKLNQLLQKMNDSHLPQ